MINDKNFIPKPLCLIIFDGWGISKETVGNAIACANTPNIDEFISEYPHTFLEASGEAVGLPDGQMGNSEVGHLNLGAGRIVYQEFARINKSIKEKDFFNNPVLKEAIENAKKNSSGLHLMGLLSDGGVHSHNIHLYALLEFAKAHNLKKVYLHLFLDGRDVLPQSALKYISELEERIKEIGIGEIATLCGRYYSMDRDKRWERVKLAYDAIVRGEGEFANTPKEAVENSYAENIVDEFVKPSVIGSFHKNQIINNNDSIIFFNFRSDRAREITRAFIDEKFSDFDRGSNFPSVFFVCMTEYDETFKIPIAFPPLRLKNVLADVLSEHNLKQLHTAETEKYAHVTFFFNGGVEEPKKGEERILIPSPKVPTYDLKPEMSAYELTEAVLNEINKDIFDVIIMNFANPDMVGHTGVYEAALLAIETVDKCVGRIVRLIKEKGGECLIVADHGNAEKMFDENKKPFTAHTSDPVFCIYITDGKVELRPGGCLADVAPTILEILKINQPKEMTGKSLIQNIKQ